MLLDENVYDSHISHLQLPLNLQEQAGEGRRVPSMSNVAVFVSSGSPHVSRMPIWEMKTQFCRNCGTVP